MFQFLLLPFEEEVHVAVISDASEAAGVSVSTVSPGELRSWAEALLRALGTPQDGAAVVAGSLVESDLRGHDSHGVRRLVPYAQLIKTGRVDPAAVPLVVEVGRTSAFAVEGAKAFGQLTARLAADAVAERAARTGAAVAVLRHCQHVGRLGEYVERIAEKGLAGYAFANADATVAPWGGRNRLLGTNPLAWAAPVGAGSAPLVVDFATSATAEGKLAVSRGRGQSVPEGLILDAQGKPSTDPDDFYAGGALLPFGGHKGYGLGVIADVLAGLASGTGSASSRDYDGTFGTIFVAFDVGTFVDLSEFMSEIEQLRERVHNSPRSEGSSGVLLPGEPEWRTRRDRLAFGIPLAAATAKELDDLAAVHNLPSINRTKRES